MKRVILDLKNIRKMWPNIKLFGIRYWWDIEYRELMRKKKVNRKTTLNRRKAYGGSWPRNTKRRKNALFRRDGNICFWCGNIIRRNEATIDHIIPRKQGGSNNLENLRLVHNCCRVERDRLIAKGIVRIDKSQE